MHVGRKYLMVGGAGFLGSHFVDRLMRDSSVSGITIYDNFSSGREWHYEAHRSDPRLRVVRADVNDLTRLKETMLGHDVVFHFASNPDIAAAVLDPDIDFREGTVLTRNVLEAMRVSSVGRIIYTSGSGVYGDLGEHEAKEDHGPLRPISTYGASKLAGEALISAYCYMFGLSGCVFRFGNVVGPRQTHGVGFDFARRLLKTPGELRILGDGEQSKSYIHADDVVEAVLKIDADQKEAFNVYNVATGDYITVNEIAEIACEAVGLNSKQVKLEHTGGDRGWKGDVPIVRLNTDRIRGAGWVCRRNSRQALQASISSMVADFRSGKLTL